MTNKRSGFTSRTKARKRAADVLFEADQRRIGFSSTAILKLLEERKVITAAQTPLPAYSIEIVQGVAANLLQIDDLLRQHVKNRELERLPSFDLAAMRIAVWEMLENADNVPPITAIDEAVAIVKHISTTESPAYVNAVLDAVRKDISSWATSQPKQGEDSLAGQTTPEVAAPVDTADGEIASPTNRAAESAKVIQTTKVDVPEFCPSTIPADLDQEIEKIAVADLDDDLLNELLDEY